MTSTDPTIISRTVFAGNTYARTVIMWDAGGGIVLCDESFRSCTQSSRSRGAAFVPKKRNRPASPSDWRLLEEAARLARSGRGDMKGLGAMKLMVVDEVRARAERLEVGQLKPVPLEERYTE